MAARGLIKIAVVAPATPVKPEAAQRVRALIDSDYRGRAEIHFHPQCFRTDGHFAGSDAERSAAFLETANDADFDAVWFGRGGYGSVRLDPALYGALGPAARAKTYLGYSDLGMILARLYRDRVGRPVHGPMANDILRPGGEAAARRALDFLIGDGAQGVEPAALHRPTLAFNLTILENVIGTQSEPDFADHVLMVEEIGEHFYRIDRSFAHVFASTNVRRAAGLMLGRVSEVPQNDPPFGRTEEEIARDWCARSGVAYLGRADIGHDADNKIVPFGVNAKLIA